MSHTDEAVALGVSNDRISSVRLVMGDAQLKIPEQTFVLLHHADGHRPSASVTIVPMSDGHQGERETALRRTAFFLRFLIYVLVRAVIRRHWLQLFLV